MLNKVSFGAFGIKIPGGSSTNYRSYLRKNYFPINTETVLSPIKDSYGGQRIIINFPKEEINNESSVRKQIEEKEGLETFDAREDIVRRRNQIMELESTLEKNKSIYSEHDVNYECKQINGTKQDLNRIINQLNEDLDNYKFEIPAETEA